MIRSRYDYRNAKAERAEKVRFSGNRLLFVGLGLFAVAAVLVTINLGRPYLYLRDVGQFVAGLDTNPPAQVKRELQRLAPGLEHANPMIQRAAVAAMKVATGKNLGDDPDVWIVWWREAGPTWEYRRTNVVPVEAP